MSPRRICLTGSESTGKTELARALAAHFSAPWSAEYAREYAMAVGRPLTADDVEPIARGQMRNEDAAIAAARDLAILDTDLISTIVYAEHYYGSVPPWIREAARERLADLYLLCDIDIPFAPDAVRDDVSSRPEHLEAFRRILIALGGRSEIVRGTDAERFERALEIVSRAAAD